jgi:hypothetical protein
MANNNISMPAIVGDGNYSAIFFVHSLYTPHQRFFSGDYDIITYFSPNSNSSHYPWTNDNIYENFASSSNRMNFLPPTTIYAKHMYSCRAFYYSGSNRTISYFNNAWCGSITCDLKYTASPYISRYSGYLSEFVWVKSSIASTSSYGKFGAFLIDKHNI